MTRPTVPEIEALFAQFFDFPTQDEYENQLRAIGDEMGQPVIFISDLTPDLAEAMSR